MKLKITILLVLINCIALISQNTNLELLKFIENEAINWESKEFETLNSKEQEFISLSIKFGCQIDKNDIRLLENFKKIDLNNDGIMDLVYKESCPYPEIKFYLQEKSGNFTLINKYPGKIINITETVDSTSIIIKSDACCCIDINSLKRIVIKKENFEITNSSTLYWHSEIELPSFEKLINKNIELTKYPKNTRLRTYLVENDSIEKNACVDDQYYKGNLIGKLIKQSKLKSIYRQIDLNGEEWELVIVNQEKLYAPNKMLVQIAKNLNNSILGWVKRKSKNSD